MKNLRARAVSAPLTEKPIAHQDGRSVLEYALLLLFLAGGAIAIVILENARVN